MEVESGIVGIDPFFCIKKGLINSIDFSFIVIALSPSNPL